MKRVLKLLIHFQTSTVVPLKFEIEAWWSIMMMSPQREEVKQNMMTSSNKKNFRVTGPLCRKFTGPRWIPRKGHWHGALMFSLICVWINGWVNNREAGDWRRYRAHYDVTLCLNDQMFCRFKSFNKRTKSSIIYGATSDHHAHFTGIEMTTIANAVPKYVRINVSSEVAIESFVADINDANI